MATASFTDRADVLDLIKRRHPEWKDHQVTWAWLLDTLEGGQRYRDAIYGSYRGFPRRNLVRHKREYPDPSLGNQYTNSTYIGGTVLGLAGGGPIGSSDGDVEDDDYEMRRQRTPVPNRVAEAIDTYNSKIFAGEIAREAPPGPVYDRLRAWWADVDGLGTTIDEWMTHTIGPLLVVFGQLDIAFDHPRAESGGVASQADAESQGLTACVASYILPQNMLWWRLNRRGKYAECLVREYADPAGPDPGSEQFRHWTDTESVLFDDAGEVLEAVPHRYGRVPIDRVFDRRKPRCTHVGQSRMESPAQILCEVYNRESELILSDTYQAHPLLQGPDDYAQGDDTIPIGPGWMLPKKKVTTGGQSYYEGFDVIEFPKGASESLRQNISALWDDFDRICKLQKPAGAAGTGRTTVAQSGISKQIDHEGLHDLLVTIARVFQRAEGRMLELALTVLTDGRPPANYADQVKVVYPTVFSLYAADDLAKIAVDYQGIMAAAGDSPEVETAILSEIVKKALPGRDDDVYEEFDSEIEAAVLSKAEAKSQMAEAAAALPTQEQFDLAESSAAEFSADSAHPGQGAAGGGGGSGGGGGGR
jgi:uncharacterized membrane protein YgcG